MKGPGVSIRFLGATGTVTGSKFLVEAPGAQVLVDCGLFQGLKDLRARNWSALPIDPRAIDAVVLTHAHLDHTGYLPLLVRNGFRGTIYCTPATKRLCEIVLPDSARLQEEEARHAAKVGSTRHQPARPLYTEEDAQQAIKQLKSIAFDGADEIASGVRASFAPAAHILGSASVRMETAGATILFSGDLGRATHPILRPPADPSPADALVIESTYGDRTHDDHGWKEKFAGAIARTAARGGIVVIPAFSVDRTEVILFYLRELMQSGAIPTLPVYADSPMALSSLDVYRDAIAGGSADVRDGLSPDALDPGRLIEARSPEESKAINKVTDPAIIVSASGMATGGRVLHHLERLLPDQRNTVILPGFAAEGTRGRQMVDGAKAVKLYGRYVPVNAEITQVDALSAHADSGELIGWLKRAPGAPEAAFIVHGEPNAAQGLARAIHDQLRWNAVIPSYLEHVLI